MLLLLVVAVILSSGVSLEPHVVQWRRRSNSVLLDIYGLSNALQVHGPVSQRNDSLLHVLFSNRVSPFEITNRQHGETPVSYNNPKASPYVEAFNENSDQQRSQRHRHIKSHPAQKDLPFENLDKTVPLEVNSYFTEHNKESDNVSFSQEDVEGYPRFPSPYVWGYEKKNVDAVILDALRERHGWPGYRASIESQPLKPPARGPEETYPVRPRPHKKRICNWPSNFNCNAVPPVGEETVPEIVKVARTPKPPSEQSTLAPIRPSPPLAELKTVSSPESLSEQVPLLSDRVTTQTVPSRQRRTAGGPDSVKGDSSPLMSESLDKPTKPSTEQGTTGSPDIVKEDSSPFISESLEKPTKPSTEQETTGSSDIVKEDSSPFMNESLDKPTKPSTKQETAGSPDIVKEDGYKVVCYFTNWSWYRVEGPFMPSDIDYSLCTNIVYAFAVLDDNDLLIKSDNSWTDYDNKFFERVTDHKSEEVKVSISMGGTYDSANRKYSNLVKTPDQRHKFIKNVIHFIKDNNFDGLDLTWHHPVCWESNCSSGPEADKANFIALLKELKTEFEPYGLLLSAIVSNRIEVINKGYDVSAMAKYLDWMTVVTYDYHGQEDGKTGHVAPMYAHSQDDNYDLNTNTTIRYLIEKGADPKKLLMSIPMYGRSFTLAQSDDNTLNQKTIGGGKGGDYTALIGFLAHHEICYNILNEGWTVVRDPEGSMGPYAYKGDQWISFDDPDSIRNKTKFVKKMGLGGAMIWSLDLDDFDNRCECERYPLLKTINRGLRNYTEPDPGCALLGDLYANDPSSSQCQI